MYGIFTYIWLKFMVNVGKYAIHGSYGNWILGFLNSLLLVIPIIGQSYGWGLTLYSTGISKARSFEIPWFEKRPCQDEKWKQCLAVDQKIFVIGRLMVMFNPMKNHGSNSENKSKFCWRWLDKHGNTCIHGNLSGPLLQCPVSASSMDGTSAGDKPHLMRFLKPRSHRPGFCD